MIGIIAAINLDHLIGFKGQIPWKKPEDQKRFRQLTLDSTIIMGRKTYESIGRPLPKRKNIVVSKTLKFTTEDNQELLAGTFIDSAESLEEALEISKGESKIWIIGGEMLYKQALPLADMLDLTLVNHRLSEEEQLELKENPSLGAYFPSDYSRYFRLHKKELNANDQDLLHSQYYRYIIKYGEESKTEGQNELASESKETPEAPGEIQKNSG